MNLELPWQAGILIKHIYDYSVFPSLNSIGDPVIKMAFTAIKINSSNSSANISQPTQQIYSFSLHNLQSAPIRLEQNFDVDLRVVPEKSYGSALQYFTGSKEQ